MHPAFADWKKKASMVLADEDVEKAFMDQAYPFVANKARPIMQAPYRLGFEVVYKNDDNTRMVGIFAFRIGSNLLYVPVFFLNGEIKGTDLLYRHTTKTFVPLTTEWVTFLLETTANDIGNGVDRRFTNRLPTDLDLRRLAQPPANRKMASAQIDETRAAWAAMQESRTLQPILREFLVKDAGISGLRLIENTMAADFTFANNLYSLLPEDHYAPALENTAIKKASAEKPVLYIARRPEDAGDLSKSASFWEDGWALVDMRKKADLSPIFADAEKSLSGIDSPGIYNVIIRGEGMTEVFAARSGNVDVGVSMRGGDGYLTGGCCGSSYWGESARPSYITIVALKGDQASGDRCEGVMGEFVTDLKGAEEDRKIFSRPAVGKAYRIFTKSDGMLSAPFYIMDSRQQDGLKVLELYSGYGRRMLKLNSEIKESNLAEGVAGDDALFLEIGFEDKTPKGDSSCHTPDLPYITYNTDINPGTTADLDFWIYDGGVKRAFVFHDRDTDEFIISHRRGHALPRMSKLAATAFLAHEMKLAAEDAAFVVKTAFEKRSHSFFWEPSPLVKESAIRIRDDSRFQTYMNSDFNVQEDPTQQFTLDSEFTPDVPREQRIGDAWDPTMQNQTLMSADPNQLADMARSMNAPHLFDHGVVGSLVKTYDSSALIDKYLPKLEEAIDCVARMIFLLYWKPEDFKQLYGDDDLVNKENELLSNFKSFGAMTLSLLKQTKDRNTGTVALTT